MRLPRTLLNFSFFTVVLIDPARPALCVRVGMASFARPENALKRADGMCFFAEALHT